MTGSLMLSVTSSRAEFNLVDIGIRKNSSYRTNPSTPFIFHSLRYSLFFLPNQMFFGGKVSEVKRKKEVANFFLFIFETFGRMEGKDDFQVFDKRIYSKFKKFLSLFFILVFCFFTKLGFDLNITITNTLVEPQRDDCRILMGEFFFF